MTLAALTGAVAAAGGTATAAESDNPGLTVVFSQNKTAIMFQPNGTQVGTTSGAPTVIPYGTYNLYLDDSAGVSDVTFDLQGPGVSLVSNMSFGEEVSENWAETFQANSTYTYFDNMRPGTTWTFQTSGTAAAPTTGASTAPPTQPLQSSNSGSATSTTPIASQAPAALKGTLKGTVGATGVVTLAFKGKAVTKLAKGRYKLAVTDKDRKDGFTIRGATKEPVLGSGVGFIGTHTITVTLTPGRWLFYSTLGTKSHAFTVTSS